MRQVRQVVAVVACGTLLAGCGGTPEASPAPSGSPSAAESPSPSATPPPPERPPEVDQRNRAGAIATVRWFLESMNYAGSTGNTDTYRKIFSRDCNRCEAIAVGIERTYADGGSIRGGAWTPREFNFYGIERDVAYLDGTIDYAPQTLIPRAGDLPQDASGDTEVVHAFQLVWVAGAWQVGALDPEV